MLVVGILYDEKWTHAGPQQPNLLLVPGNIAHLGSRTSRLLLADVSREEFRRTVGALEKFRRRKPGDEASTRGGSPRINRPQLGEENKQFGPGHHGTLCSSLVRRKVPRVC